MRKQITLKSTPHKLFSVHIIHFVCFAMNFHVQLTNEKSWLHRTDISCMLCFTTMININATFDSINSKDMSSGKRERKIGKYVFIGSVSFRLFPTSFFLIIIIICDLLGQTNVSNVECGIVTYPTTNQSHGWNAKNLCHDCVRCVSVMCHVYKRKYSRARKRKTSLSHYLQWLNERCVQLTTVNNSIQVPCACAP